MISSNQIDRNSLLLQQPKLIRSPEPGLHVGPATIKQITRNDHKVDVAGYGQLNETLEGRTSRFSQSLDRRTGILCQPLERGIEMQIGGMQKTKHERRPRFG